jgi:phosphoglycerate dehydrogenase-like enzyme
VQATSGCYNKCVSNALTRRWTRATYDDKTQLQHLEERYELVKQEGDHMRTILVGLDPEGLAETQLARLYDLAGDACLVITRERAEVEAILGDIEVAAAGFPRELLVHAPSLRWYQQWGAGANWLMDCPEAIEQDWILTNVSGMHAIQISEHIFAFLLAFARALPESCRAQHRREWLRQHQTGVFELYGKTALVIGLGPIGRRTVELAGAFGMHILGVRRDPTRSVPGIDELVGPDGIDDLLPAADFVIVTVPLTPETQGWITTQQFRLMKPSAYLINIGRGGTIVERDLVQALRENRIAGAGLDVFETEPLPEESPLWEMKNVIITAHYSGRTPHYTERAMEIFLDNLERYQAGEPLRNVVDKQLGY